MRTNKVLPLIASYYQHYYQYLASKQRLQVAQEISTISELILETTQRYSDAGNVTALKLAEAKIGASEAKLELLQTQAANLMARTKMSETLGIRASQSWHLPDQLPLPDIANREANEDLDKAIQQALKQRPDLKAARSKIAALRLRLKSHNLENTTGDIELGAERERETGGERLTGPCSKITQDACPSVLMNKIINAMIVFMGA
jgi:outer membrane protein TolC